MGEGQAQAERKEGALVSCWSCLCGWCLLRKDNPMPTPNFWLASAALWLMASWSIHSPLCLGIATSPALAGMEHCFCSCHIIRLLAQAENLLNWQEPRQPYCSLTPHPHQVQTKGHSRVQTKLFFCLTTVNHAGHP